MGEETLGRLLSFFKALADETRLRIVGLVANEERSVEELATLLGVTEPTVSHHLNRLKETGLVRMRAEGAAHLYSLNPDALHRLSRELLSRETITRAVADIADDRFEQKVLRSFLLDGRLVEIPAQRKKRDVVLRWLAGHFAPGRRYPEREVNEIIKQFHPDYATLRRELIMTRLMEREDGGGDYWRR